MLYLQYDSLPVRRIEISLYQLRSCTRSIPTAPQGSTEYLVEAGSALIQNRTCYRRAMESILLRYPRIL